MAAEDGETALSLSFDGAQSKTLADQIQGHVQASIQSGTYQGETNAGLNLNTPSHSTVDNEISNDVFDEGDDQEYEYSVGDFVWSKFNAHPWWPAQIYDPSDASDFAKKGTQRGRPIFVVYFADGSFSWRSSSELKPFAEYFDEFSKPNGPKLLLKAVQDAVDEIGRVAKLKMTCHCISEEEKAGLIREEMVHIGLKRGVFGPEYDLTRVPVADFNPLEMYSNLSDISVGKMDQSMLSMTWLRGHLLAFYCARRGRDLVSYNEIKTEETEMYGSSCGLRKCATRNRRCVAKLMKENTTVKANRVSSSENGSDKDEEENGQIVGICNKNSDEDEVVNGQMTSSRKRKKSWYLCYPYTNTITSVKGSKRDLISKIHRVGGTSLVSGPETRGNEEKKMIELDKVKASPEEVITKVQSAAVDPQSLLGSDSYDSVIDFVRAFTSDVFVKGSTYNNPLSKKQKSPEFGENNQNETNDEMITGSDCCFKAEEKSHSFNTDLKGGSKKKKKREKMTKDEVSKNEGLLSVKQKMEKVIKMVGNCDRDMFTGVKPILENEMQGVLGEISVMLDIGSS